jgi:hypothetical protein
MDLNHMRNAIDAKEYRLIKVYGSNLDCVLISTKEKNVKAAAAMAVQVGSFADPFVAGIYLRIPFCFCIRSFLKLLYCFTWPYRGLRTFFGGIVRLCISFCV